MARQLTAELRDRRRRLVLAASVAGLVLVQCGFPSDDSVKADFLRDNPSATVLDVGSGEGDGDTVYKIIRFRAPGNAAECQVEWGYQRESNSRVFRIFTKGEPSCRGSASSKE